MYFCWKFHVFLPCWTSSEHEQTILSKIPRCSEVPKKDELEYSENQYFPCKLARLTRSKRNANRAWKLLAKHNEKCLKFFTNKLKLSICLLPFHTSTISAKILTFSNVRPCVNWLNSEFSDVTRCYANSESSTCCHFFFHERNESIRNLNNPEKNLRLCSYFLHSRVEFGEILSP